MSFLNIEGKVFVIFGVANKESVAWAIAKTLEAEKAKVIYVVRSEERKEFIDKNVSNAEVYTCDDEVSEEIEKVCREIASKHPNIQGICHSIAYAN